MTPGIRRSASTDIESRIKYGQLTLLALAERIADNDDPEALKELHDNRSLCHSNHGRKVRLAEYIAALRDSETAQRWCDHDDLVLDEAYNRTLDKFHNVPVQTDNGEQQCQQGPDRRYYLKAYIRYTTARLTERPPANSLEAEMFASEALRRFVDRQFFFSCLEAKRRQYGNFVRRYRWRLAGGDLYVWLPLEVRLSRQWLQANIGEVDSQRPGEKERVQAIVDQLLGKRQIFFLSELHQIGQELPPSPDPLLSMIEEQVSVEGLAETVAGEKAENIDQQRPTIRRLGRERLKELIRRIFDALARREYLEKEIAGGFGLNAATLSRFAGAHWRQGGKEVIADCVPDLWRNLAHTLAGHATFIKAARKAGVWKQVHEILDAEKTRENSR